jgi:hypothetical protein
VILFFFLSVLLGICRSAGAMDAHVDIHSDSSLIGPNFDQWNTRVGAHPERLNNLYFAFVFMLRAVNKASPLLLNYDYNTGNPVEDAELKQKIHSL